MVPKNRIENLPPYKPGKQVEEVKQEYNLTEVIKLASNENPFGSSQKVKETLMEAVGKLEVYPDGNSTELRTVLSQFLNVSKEQLIFGNGSDEIIQMISRAYLDSDVQTIMATPTFPQYKSNAIVEGAKFFEVPLKNGKHDLEAMRNAITSFTRVIWICNPNNPTGTIITEKELNRFLEQVPKNILVVLDEAYYEYVTDQEYPDSIPLICDYPNLIILRTFSKIYGLAALRIGYGISSPIVIDILNRVREPFNNTTLSQKGAVAAIQDQQFIQYCKEENQKGLKQLYQGFDQLGFSYYRSQGNFVLVDVGQPANEVFMDLIKKGIIVRSGEALGFPTSLRITVGNEEQNNKVLTAISEVVKTKVV